MPPDLPYRVGLTGGIGSGKSTVAEGFAHRGVAIVDADALAHELTLPGGAAMEAIAKTFGSEFVAPDGSLDRARMRELVFRDDQKRLALEHILHPLIRHETERRVRMAESPYVLLVIPLLLESKKGAKGVERVLVVDCSEEEQITRVMQRSQLSRAEVEAIMARQIGRAERLLQADDVIENSGGKEALDHQIQPLHERYLIYAKAVQSHARL
ncbi:MAG: dephospho-CoA kinase [Burkholderiaceae bacterium]